MGGVVKLMDDLFGSMKFSEKAMDAAWLTNKTISQNIANVDTPGYKRKTVKFEEILKSSSAQSFEGLKTNSLHVDIGSSIDDENIKIVTENENLSYRIDGNNVDIDTEMASLAKNTIKYNVLAQSVNAGLKRIKTVISEGR